MTAMEAADMYVTINFEETELRLGLPASKGDLQQQAAEALVVLGKNAAGKRGFSETVDLKLNLSSSTKMDGRDHHDEAPMNTRNYDHDNMMNNEKLSSTAAAAAAADSCSNNDPAKPPAKAQVVGWPPIRSFRKNVMAVQKSNDGEASKKSPAATVQSAAFVKVSMDGAPYLRKVDLKLYKSYDQLSQALAKMFSSFTTENRGPSGMKDFMNESKLVDILNGSKYVPSYEDQDGDWMLVGDVPWEMFVESCKRLRIMKGSEATGLAPRAVEKCKSRS